MMKMVPIFRCRDMKRALSFYTNVLDFTLAEPGASADDWVVLLTNDHDAQLILTSLEGDQKIGIAANVMVDEVDKRYQKYIQRGLNVSNKKESPVHQGPLDQTWGTREFYVTDEDGNTLRFCKVN